MAAMGKVKCHMVKKHALPMSRASVPGIARGNLMPSANMRTVDIRTSMAENTRVKSMATGSTGSANMVVEENRGNFILPHPVSIN